MWIFVIVALQVRVGDQSETIYHNKYNKKKMKVISKVESFKPFA